MTQFDTYNSTATAFLSPVNEQTFQITQEGLFRTDRTRISALMAKPVNNYLKTEDEIETEFCYANLDVFKRNNKDGYTNIHTLDVITISGTMEENY